MPPIVRHKLKGIRGMATCPKCGYSGEIKTKKYAIPGQPVQTKVMFICSNCDYME
jgi:C4-type Zn-finger protein